METFSGFFSALSHFWREVSPPGPTRGTIAELADDWMQVTSVSLWWCCHTRRRRLQ